MSQKVHKVSKAKYMSVTEKTNAKQDTAVVLAFDFVQEVVKPSCPLLKSSDWQSRSSSSIRSDLPTRTETY